MTAKARRLTNIRLREVSTVNRGANQHATVVLWKHAPDEDTTPGAPGTLAGSSGDTSPMKEDTMSDALEKQLGDVQAQLAAMEADHTALAKALASAAKSDGVKVEKTDDGYTVTVEKQDPPEMIEVDGELIEKAAIPAPLLKRMEADRARIEKIEGERRHASPGVPADAELPHLSGETIHKAALLKAVDTLEPAEVEAVTRMLKAANEAARAYTQELGAVTKEADANDPEVRIEDMAKALVEKGQEPNLIQARAAVLKSPEGRALRAQSTH